MTPKEFRQRLTDRSSLVGLSLSEAHLVSLEKYYRILVAWNARINLTALDVRELPPAAVDRLFIEPLLAACLVVRSAVVLDIASGGGSPAIPFAIGSEAAHLTMVESRAKKAVFLREAARSVGLEAEVIDRRLDDSLTERAMRGRYDVVTLRAVKLGPAMSNRLAELLTPDGCVLFFQTKGTGFQSRYGLGDHLIRPLTAQTELLVLSRNVPRGTRP